MNGMSLILKQIIDKSGKKTVVSYENKEKRQSFNDDIAFKKVNLISKMIGSEENSIALSKALSKK